MTPPDITPRQGGFARITAPPPALAMAPAPVPTYSLYRDERVRTWSCPMGRTLTTQAHDLLLAETAARIGAIAPGGTLSPAWSVPKSMLDPHLPPLPRPLAMVLPARCGVVALAASCLDARLGEADPLSGPILHGVDETLCRLLGLACGKAMAGHPDQGRAGRLAQARQLIDRHLAEPGLTPARIARKMGVSVRALHLLFASTHTSFSRYVQNRRLQECRAALLADPARPVLDVAYAWGFASVSSFYRAFRATFALTPGELRQGACGQA